MYYNMKIPQAQSHPLIFDFIRTPTPEAWFIHASQHLPELLLDHAHCERKAAANAINFITKYPVYPELIEKMTPLAREELLHLEKVLAIMKKREIKFRALPHAKYGAYLHNATVKLGNSQKMIDELIVGAIIEARSCERFLGLIPYLDGEPELQKFYASLVKSEGRHFEDYLQLARLYGNEIDARIDHLVTHENAFIVAKDKDFRFHSGCPA